MIVLIDNYDSFTHNLFQYLSELTSEEIRVVRNDRITLPALRDLHPSRIVISPGPGRPEDAGISVQAITEFAGTTPILGVCLGHQAIGYAFGARIVQAARIVHGKAEPIATDGRGLFRSIPSPSVFTRYHSPISHRPDSRLLLPVTPTEVQEGSFDEQYIYEPPAEELLGSLLPRALDSIVYETLLQSAAAEEGARMTAMTAATDNAEQMITDLTRDLNRARQTQITAEILEVVSGAEAVG